jgi:hypothetical protein
VHALSGTASISEPAALDISGWIAHWAQVPPARRRCASKAVSLSYAEIERDVRWAAAWLGASGVSRGGRVGGDRREDWG